MYINQAIASGGIIDQAIATQVKKAQDELQSKIDAINERLDALEDRLGKLEEDFVNRIQSLKYIPEYSDRKVQISEVFKTISLDFLVSPSSQAKAVQQAWDINDEVVTAYIRSTKKTETRAISPATQLFVTSVVGNDDGTLNVILKEDAANPIDTELFEGGNDAVVYIKISDGNSDIFSDMVDIAFYIELSVYEDLSPMINGVYQTSNCYIVSKAGAYKFKAYKGNSNELAGDLDSDIHPKGKIDHTKVLWESFGTDIKPEVGDLIKCTDYKDGYVVFETSESYKEGNAVIAVRDESGNVLWSWHIWLTDQPQEHIYKNDAGTMMDRNLGAISATPGDVGALGLLYQWGRKDPFLGSYSSITSGAFAKSTISWPSTVSSNSSNGTISYATAHPTTFMTCNSSNFDWYYTGSSSTDITRWTTSYKDKSIYDPCPSGWRVPDGDSSGVWRKAGFDDTTYESTNKGISFSISSPSPTWYPASGFRNYDNGSVAGVGIDGFYWSASPNYSNLYYAYCLGFYYNGDVYPSYDFKRAYGLSVRCQKE